MESHRNELITFDVYNEMKDHAPAEHVGTRNIELTDLLEDLGRFSDKRFFLGNMGLSCMPLQIRRFFLDAIQSLPYEKLYPSIYVDQIVPQNVSKLKIDGRLTGEMPFNMNDLGFSRYVGQRENMTEFEEKELNSGQFRRLKLGDKVESPGYFSLLISESTQSRELREGKKPDVKPDPFCRKDFWDDVSLAFGSVPDPCHPWVKISADYEKHKRTGADCRLKFEAEDPEMISAALYSFAPVLSRYFWDRQTMAIGGAACEDNERNILRTAAYLNEQVLFMDPRD